jgi:hypothetical protein
VKKCRSTRLVGLCLVTAQAVSSLWMLAASLGCSSTDDGAKDDNSGDGGTDDKTKVGALVDVLDFASTMSEKACSSLASCCTALGLTFDRAGCGDVVLPAMEFYVSDKTEYVEAMGSVCLSSLSAQLSTCSAPWPPELTACRAALPGTVEEGGACLGDFECRPLKNNTVRCTDNVCTAILGIFTPDVVRGGWGSECRDNEECYQGSCQDSECVPTSLSFTCVGQAMPTNPVGTETTCYTDQPCPNELQECVYSPIDEKTTCQVAGGTGQPCHVDGTCDAGLACENQLCVKAGGEGEPCKTDGSCSSGLECRNNPSACHEDPTTHRPECCLPVGGDGEACPNSEACDTNLSCVETTKYCNYDAATGKNACCREAGGERQPCRKDEPCDAGLECVEELCVNAGGLKGPCNEDRSCDEWLECRHDYDVCSLDYVTGTYDCCLPVGGDGELCLADGTCKTGLTCTTVSSCPWDEEAGDNVCCL